MAPVIVPLALVMICLRGGVAYPTGAPISACVSMIPGHYGISESTSPNPYSITTSASTYTPGATVTVYISGSSFKGILLQARAVGSTTPLGTFSNFPADTKGIACGSVSNSAVTHSSTTDKSSGTSFTWTAPSGLTDEVEFIATIAAEKSIWWSNTKSGSLSLASGAGSTTTKTTTTTAPTTTTTTRADTSTKSSSLSPGPITFSLVALLTTLAVSLVGINTLRM